MGKYSGILLCSDFDGTLFDGVKIPEKNLKAIREFRREGGLFTVISGRNVEFLTPFFAGDKLGVPVGNLNGAVIYDIDSGKVIRESFMSGLTCELAIRFMKESQIYSNAIFFPKNGLIRVPKDRFELVTEELCRSTYKFIIELDRSCSKEESDKVFSSAKLVAGDKFEVVRSSYHLIEILDKRLSKASAALFLKEYTGAHTLVCVGDFENDIDMIRAADIGYAVENAEDSVKCSADRITCDVKDGAIAEIISEL